MISYMQQANFLLPDDLLKELRTLVPRGEQSAVVSAALRHELTRRKLAAALQDSFGAWKTARRQSTSRQIVRAVRRDRRI